LELYFSERALIRYDMIASGGVYREKFLVILSINCLIK
jgi:hypothetical protein